MKGAARAAERRRDENTVMAYQAATFRGASTAGKLKGIKHYLIHKPERRAQTPAEMFAILQQYQAGGAPISIREIN